MIRTRYGSEVVIVTNYPNEGKVQLRRIADNKMLECFTTELRADGGFNEIFAAIDLVPAIQT